MIDADAITGASRLHYSEVPVPTSTLRTDQTGRHQLRVKGFGELEAVIMDRIWDRGPTASITVRDIFDQLVSERGIAYTTVMSTMDNLHSKGWLAREREGKAYRYWATLSREEHSARLMREALEGGGQPDLVLSHFVKQMTTEESDGLRAALRRMTSRTKPR